MLQLFVSQDTIGALNLYSRTPEAFPQDERVAALALASHVAVAMLASQDHEDMKSALANRTIIGQAQGMLMQGLRISSDQAFAALARVSQHKNIKVHVVARDIVENGIRSELFELT